jgi:hypothetical protein
VPAVVCCFGFVASGSFRPPLVALVFVSRVLLLLLIVSLILPIIVYYVLRVASYFVCC